MPGERNSISDEPPFRWACPLLALSHQVIAHRVVIFYATLVNRFLRKRAGGVDFMLAWPSRAARGRCMAHESGLLVALRLGCGRRVGCSCRSAPPRILDDATARRQEGRRLAVAGRRSRCCWQ